MEGGQGAEGRQGTKREKEESNEEKEKWKAGSQKAEPQLSRTRVALYNSPTSSLEFP